MRIFQKATSWIQSILKKENTSNTPEESEASKLVGEIQHFATEEFETSKEKRTTHLETSALILSASILDVSTASRILIDEGLAFEGTILLRHGWEVLYLLVAFWKLPDHTDALMNQEILQKLKNAKRLARQKDNPKTDGKSLESMIQELVAMKKQNSDSFKALRKALGDENFENNWGKPIDVGLIGNLLEEGEKQEIVYAALSNLYVHPFLGMLADKHGVYDDEGNYKDIQSARHYEPAEPAFDTLCSCLLSMAFILGQIFKLDNLERLGHFQKRREELIHLETKQ